MLIARLTVPAIINGGNGEPYLARGNQFSKRNVAVLGPGELIRQGNFYEMTVLSHHRSSVNSHNYLIDLW